MLNKFFDKFKSKKDDEEIKNTEEDLQQEELENRIDNALELNDLLSLPRGFHIAENVFGQEMYIWRETVGEGYSLMFRTHNKNELYIEDFNEDGQLINCRYEEVELD